ncbi:hypothetical protein MHYP_G00042600 [Metynnis hypsauchen]
MDELNESARATSITRSQRWRRLISICLPHEVEMEVVDRNRLLILFTLLILKQMKFFTLCVIMTVRISSGSRGSKSSTFQNTVATQPHVPLKEPAQRKEATHLSVGVRRLRFCTRSPAAGPEPDRQKVKGHGS